jgi:hypothetical protein
VIATITHHGDLAIAHSGYAFQQEVVRVARVAQHHDLTDTWLPARRENEEPIPFPQRRLHAVARDGHAPWAASHFFVA